METEKELEILEYIHKNSEVVRQRDLAKIAGVSLGMINVVLKRMATKGWIQVKKVNNRNIQYVVSPAGLEAISRKSYRFFKKTIKNLVYYRELIEKLVLRVKKDGFTTIVLVGRSDVDFIVEHYCRKHGVEYEQVDILSEMMDTMKYYMLSEIYSEDVNVPDGIKSQKVLLRTLFIS